MFAVANDFERNRQAAIHRDAAVTVYYATCVDDSTADKHVPSGKAPVGLVWNQMLASDQDAGNRPDVAVWLL